MSSKLRIIPLGGAGEIGKNMTILEYEDEILVVDAGVMFPESDMLGIDLIIPDYNYLKREDRLDKVKAVLITHGHEDHIGALQHVMVDIKAPIYATPLTAGFIEGKLRQAKLWQERQLITFKADDVFRIGCFTIEPFHVTHSIPDCVGFGITTPVGLVVHTGDYKFDHTPVDNWPPDFAKLAEFSRRGVLCLLADSTNAGRPGWTPSESIISDGFDNIFRVAKGRIIVATFASLISRIQQVAEVAQKYGRKIAITGRSMRENTKIARRLGYLNVSEEMMIDINQAVNLPENEVVIMATGAQGEPTAVMGKMARGRHGQLKVKEGDTIVFSAHPIPGNEEIIFRTINQLFRRGAYVYYEQNAHVHVSGHASQEEMKLMINLIRPKFLVPLHGELRHLKLHGEIAQELGIPPENVAIIENGTPLELDETSMTILPRMSGGYIFVDGDSVGDIGWPVVRDREKLAQSGVFFAVVFTNGRGELLGKPEMLSRGFISGDEVEAIMQGAVDTITRTLKVNMNSFHVNTIGSKLEDALSNYLYDETGRRPLIHVVVK